jgi:SAM-dependent methyltransferase
MPIDRIAARGFSAGAGAYERARPAYPPEAVGALAHRLRMTPGKVVLDLGAGTGKLTALLLPTGAAIRALEPVAEMRARLAAALPAVGVAAGVAEAIPFAPSSFDAVVAAQAFHWFDGPSALDEIHRVLRQGGGLGLVWNARDHATPWVAEMSAIVDEYGDAIRRHETGEWRAAFDGATGFGPLQMYEFRNVQEVGLDGVLDRVSSTSFIAMMRDDERATVLGRVEDVLRNHPDTRGREQFSFPHLTRVYCCDRV